MSEAELIVTALAELSTRQIAEPIDPARRAPRQGREVARFAALCHHPAMNTGIGPITIDPQRRSGRACVRDLRISVGDVLGWLAGGLTPEQVLADYPELTLADIRACLAYAAARESYELRLPVAA